MIKNRSGLQGTIFSDKATSSVREMTLVGPINRSNTFQHIPTLNLQFLRFKKLPKRLYNLSAWWAQLTDVQQKHTKASSPCTFLCQCCKLGRSLQCKTWVQAMFVFLGKYMIHAYNPEPMQMMACLRCGIYVGSVLCRGSTTMPQAGVWTNWIGSAPRCLQKQHYWSHWRTEMTKFVVLLVQDGCWNMLKQVSAPVQPLSHVVTMCLRWAH